MSRCHTEMKSGHPAILTDFALHQPSRSTFWPSRGRPRIPKQQPQPSSSQYDGYIVSGGISPWCTLQAPYSDSPSIPRRRLKRLHHGRRSAPGTLAARGGAEERRQNKQKHVNDRFILYKTATLANFRPGNAHMKELIDPHTALNPNPNRGLDTTHLIYHCYIF